MPKHGIWNEPPMSSIYASHCPHGHWRPLQQTANTLTPRHSAGDLWVSTKPKNVSSELLYRRRESNPSQRVWFQRFRANLVPISQPQPPALVPFLPTNWHSTSRNNLWCQKSVHPSPGSEHTAPYYSFSPSRWWCHVEGMTCGFFELSSALSQYLRLKQQSPHTSPWKKC